MATKGEAGARLGGKVKVSKWKHPHYNWRASYLLGGRYRQKGFKTRKEADEWAEKREKEATEFGTASKLTTAERSAVVESRENLKRLGLSISEAIEFAVSYHERAKRSTTVRDFFATFTEKWSRKRNKRGLPLSDAYLKELQKRLGRFVDKFGDTTIANIEDTHVEDWLDNLSKNFDPQTVEHHRRNVFTMFEYAVKKKYADENPVQNVEGITVGDALPGILTPSQLSDLLTSADDEILPAFAIGAFAGVRDAEIKRMDWTMIDFEAATITLSEDVTKSRNFRIVTMPDNLVEWLKPRAKLTGPIWPKNGRKLHDAAKIKAGFADPEKLPKTEREKREDWNEWPHNALRHSYASYHFMFYKDTRELALNMGHTDHRMIVKHYRKRVSEKAAKTYWKIVPNQAENIVEMKREEVA